MSWRMTGRFQKTMTISLSFKARTNCLKVGRWQLASSGDCEKRQTGQRQWRVCQPLGTEAMGRRNTRQVSMGKSRAGTLCMKHVFVFSCTIPFLSGILFHSSLMQKATQHGKLWADLQVHVSRALGVEVCIWNPRTWWWSQDDENFKAILSYRKKKKNWKPA